MSRKNKINDILASEGNVASGNGASSDQERRGEITHTPGPWFLSISEDYGGIEMFLSEKAATSSRYRAIHRIELYDDILDNSPQHDKDWNEALANARLICAAPELLKCLKYARAFIAREVTVFERSYLPDPDEDQAAELNHARKLLAAIDETIAKAEGTPPGRAEQSPDPSQSTEAKS